MIFTVYRLTGELSELVSLRWILEISPVWRSPPVCSADQTVSSEIILA